MNVDSPKRLSCTSVMFACLKVEEHWPNLRNFFPLPMYRSDYCQVCDRRIELVVTLGVGVLTDN
ncbi:hypothetical protein QUB56_21360 [Microcoleus sp. AR_TQ3_B6]|uniref:hypothetical protein n=1 Tax=Microcoleus sp. AR_TQ3_B6 TaxID=3055284 RepID=UPI002FD697F5